jgi:hypothetical protein
MLKLYVWSIPSWDEHEANPVCLALAHSVEEARRIYCDNHPLFHEEVNTTEPEIYDSPISLFI